ncbi:MAG: DUF547 domain-containing protein [Deinococcota bacterium]
MNYLKRSFILTALCLLVWQHASAQVYNTARLDRLLRTYVSDTGYVDYEAWFNNDQDLADVREFVADLAEFDPSTLASEDEQLAFWINAYNILAIEEVLERYPVDTIRPSILRIPERSFFTEQEHVVNGENYSLDEIENEVIRRDFNEPRIHFAINCASESCPALRAEAYTAEKLETQLQEQAIAFINNPARNQFDATTNTAHLSRIFDWFEEDFEIDGGGVADYLLPFVEGDAAAVLTSDDLTIRHLRYDWSLNQQ